MSLYLLKKIVSNAQTYHTDVIALNQKINYIPIYNVTTLKNLKKNINKKYTITKNNQEINEKEEVFDEVQFDKTPWYVYVIICLSVFFTFYTISFFLFCFIL